MLYSSKYNFVYSKSVKTGSTSTEASLEYLIRGDIAPHHTHSLFYEDGSRIGFRGWKQKEDPNFGTEKFSGNHVSLKVIRRLIGAELFNSAFKISSIRNPYDRVISSFHWCEKNSLGRCVNSKKDGNVNAIKDDFSKFINSNPNAKYNASDHFFCDSEMVIDHFVRMEKMNGDLDFALNKLDVPSDIRNLIINNIPEFKKTSRSESALQFSDYYSRETLEVVNNVYSKWFDLGGYTCVNSIHELDQDFS